MYLTRLRLSDFRSYELVDLSLGPGTTIFTGPNGYGKTNLVEAVHYLATLGSHRVSTDLPLIRDGASSATISGVVQAGLDDNRSLSVAVEIRSGQPNKALLNKASVRPREILGAVRTVVFAPEDLSIVRGDPAQRRGFIDELVISRWPRLAGVKGEYDRALKQKTAVLKAVSGRGTRSAGAGAEETLDVWGEEMARFGAELLAARLATLRDLQPFVTRNYDEIAPVASKAGIAYSSSSVPPDAGSDVEGLRQILSERTRSRRGEEIARGVCLVGPHRDDLAFSLGTLPVKGYASHGEGWSFALALRLASVDLLREDGVEPILILDDVFAELDEHRRARVVQTMDTVEQALVTVAVRRDIPDTLSAVVYEVGRGYVTGPAPFSPAHPANPDHPADSAHMVSPANPVNLENPSRPVNLADSADSVNPVRPANPADPAVPVVSGLTGVIIAHNGTQSRPIAPEPGLVGQGVDDSGDVTDREVMAGDVGESRTVPGVTGVIIAHNGTQSRPVGSEHGRSGVSDG